VSLLNTNSQFAGVYPSGGLPELNVAATAATTHALGPGLRSVVWVQGCPFHCPGCIAPDWIPTVKARRVRPELLAEELVQNQGICGLTFSGGEPMLQAQGLAKLARLARQRRPDLSLICYTGFTLEKLLTSPGMAGVIDLIEECDVLIDGMYIAALNDNRGLRGSSNQRILHLTDRLAGFDFETGPRRVEVTLQAEIAEVVGIPPRGFEPLFHEAVEKAQTLVGGLL